MKNKGVRSLTELPQELQFDFLLRLPAKSLLLCKCVCKSLRILVQNPNFIQTHLTRIISSSPESLIMQLCKGEEKQLLVYTTERNPSVYSLSLTPLLPPIPDDEPDHAFIGSCNGLILIVVSLDSIYDDDDQDNDLLILWNPVIRQHRYLPKPNHTCISVLYEFGYIPETNDYVVLKIGYVQHLTLEVYKMSIDSWITINCSSRGADLISKIYDNVNSVFVNGSFHWTTKKVVDIVYYNLKDEEIGVIKALNYTTVANANEHRGIIVGNKLDVVDQSLAMIYRVWESMSGFETFEIWVMIEYGVGDSWTRKFVICDNISGCPKGVVQDNWKSDSVIMKQRVQKKFQGMNYEDEDITFLVDVNTRLKLRISRTGKDQVITRFCSFVETLVPVIKVD